MPDSEAARDWHKDGEIHNAEDARQCVEVYRHTFSRQRFLWLVKMAAAYHGHPPDARAVFEDATATIDDPRPAGLFIRCDACGKRCPSVRLVDGPTEDGLPAWECIPCRDKRRVTTR